MIKMSEEVFLGFELIGWLFEKGGKELMVFVGSGSPNGLHLVEVSDQQTKIYDSLGKEVKIEKGKATIVNGAPYTAVGGKLEEVIVDMGSK